MVCFKSWLREVIRRSSASGVANGDPSESARIGRLKEGGLCRFLDHETPGRIVSVVRCQPPKNRDPIGRLLGFGGPSRRPERQSAKLYEEHVPRGALVRAHRREPLHLPSGHRRRRVPEADTLVLPDIVRSRSVSKFMSSILRASTENTTRLLTGDQIVFVSRYFLHDCPFQSHETNEPELRSS